MDRLYWTDKKPTKVGHYWTRKKRHSCANDTAAMVNVWRYAREPNGTLFTNWDGGAALSDPMFDNREWSDKPVPFPHEPQETS